MKQFMMAFLMVTVGVLPMSASASDVSAKLRQLKENVDNSKANLTQYEENLKTVNTNLAQIDKALKELQNQKKIITKRATDARNGKMTVSEAKRKIESYQVSEKQKIESERKQLAEMKKALEQIEGNLKKREENLVKYQERMGKVDATLVSWGENDKAIEGFEKTIVEKETQAKTEQKRLMTKKPEYEAEVNKWKKQVKANERIYASFNEVRE